MITSFVHWRLRRSAARVGLHHSAPTLRRADLFRNVDSVDVELYRLPETELFKLGQQRMGGVAQLRGSRRSSQPHLAPSMTRPAIST